MLNVSAYLPSNENYDEVPSPLVDGTDALPPVEPLVETLEPVVEAEPLPLQEFAVELPPELDPTPLQPLEGDIVQAEVLAENADAQAGQLMGAQIALEGYAKLLRSADKNMTRQSAAFMAVGMARANRLMGVQSIGLEDENSGTQVMAMQKANVDQKGLGDKIKEVAGKIWEWIKEKYEQLKGLVGKLKALFNKDKEKAVYLLAASEAVASGNDTKVKALSAPSGLRVSAALEAIYGEDARKPTPPKTINLPAGIARFVVAKGKVTLVNAGGQDVLKKYMMDAVELTRAINSAVSSMNESTTPEEASDIVSDLIKKHMVPGQGRSHVMGNIYATRTAEGILEIEGLDDEGDDSPVVLPALGEVDAYLKNFVTGEEPYTKELEELYNSGSEIMRNKAFADPHVKQLGETIFRVFRGSGINESISRVNEYIAKAHSAAVAACDFVIAAHGGTTTTVSQEDYVRMPSRGLSVIPQASGPGVVQRGMAIAREMWAKLKDYFAKKWEQFSAWAKNLWASLFGTAKDTDVLLLTNGAVPDEGDTSVVGTLPALPQGTRLKSVQATRMLEGPSAGPAAVAEPEVVPTSSPAAPAVPQGFVLVPEASELMTSGDIAIDPVWEEAMTNWLLRHYIPTQEKIVKDVISFAGSAPLDDQGMMQWQEVVDRQLPQLFQGMPVDNVPGLRAIQPGTGCKIQVRQEGMMPQAEPIRAVKKRQLDQALSRQKKLLGALAGIEKTRVVTERQRAQLNAILDRRVTQGMSEQAVTQFYNYVAESVIVSSANVIAAVIGKTCAARNAVADAMIVARAKRK